MSSIKFFFDAFVTIIIIGFVNCVAIAREVIVLPLPME
jgi:multisubunit Na+/H+ antiporter MnhF subunit